MPPLCEIGRQALEEAGGDPALVGLEVRRHLAACAVCAREAEEAQRLLELLQAAVPPPDPALQEQIAAQVRAGRRRRVLSLAPVAVGGVLLAAGVAAVGGVPGAGLAAMVPGISLGAGLAAAGGIGGLLNAGAVVLQAVHGVMPHALGVVAGGIAGVGTLLIAAGTRRLGRSLA